MAAYIRALSLSDVDRCYAVETAAFPPAEAASREKIEYRLTVCPELCFGLFVANGAQPSSLDLRQGIPFRDEASGLDGDVLIAHTIATKSSARAVRDKDMVIPEDWKATGHINGESGHQPGGRTVALHSLAVSPAYQSLGAGKGLMTAYIKKMQESNETDRISILTYDRLVPYYQKLGFTHYGKSESEYAGVAWQDLSYEFSATGAHN